MTAKSMLVTPVVMVLALATARVAVPAGDPPAPPADLLSGPTVGDSNSRSLVATDMMGGFQRVEGRPEEAAVALLVLEPEVREAASRVAEERFQAIREHVIDQIDLLRESSDATRAGDRKRAEELQLEIFRRFKDADERAPLVAPLSKVLPPERAAELARMVDEYWTAWIAEESKGLGERDRTLVEARLRYRLFQAEMTAVHQVFLVPLQQKLERIYEIAAVTDEQRAAIRGAAIAFLKETRLRPSQEARLALARSILAELSEDQRAAILAASLAAG